MLRSLVDETKIVGSDTDPMMKYRGTSLAKAYGVADMPGDSIASHTLANTHGGGAERAEGLSTYVPRWPFQNANFSNEGPAVRATEFPGVYQRNDYDHQRVMQQANRDSRNYAQLTKAAYDAESAMAFRGYGESSAAARNAMNASSDQAALGPMPRAGAPTTQSSSSRARITQRSQVGTGRYDFTDDTRTDMDTSSTVVGQRQADTDLLAERQQMLVEANAAYIPRAPPYAGNRASLYAKTAGANVVITVPVWAAVLIAALIAALAAAVLFRG